ncbi:MAG: alpha/beta hydrolase [Bacteroidetes bacterium]|nr:alpha/beta hydrolase [Bacteroidota bacterium]
MQTAIWPYRSSQFEYIRFGRGPALVFCFHGYGEQAASFALLEKQLGETHSFIAINLPWHGHTHWKEPGAFSTEHLLHVMDEIATQENISPAQYSLLGYSMGGRIALALANAAPGKINRLCLIAPDGMKMNFWYWLATQTRAGNRLFRFTMHQPGWFIGMVRTAHRLGLINTSIGKFLDYYIGDPQVRQQLYDRWTCMRRFTPHHRRLQQHIAQYRIPVRLLYGQYDRIISAARAAPFVRAAGAYCRIDILPAGHQLLQEKYIAELVRMLKN